MTQSELTKSDVTAVILDMPSPGRILLNDLIDIGIVLLEEWQALQDSARDRLLQAHSTDELLAHLVEQRLLTQYQASRIRGGEGVQLVLGNYRILDQLGTGGMGAVYRAEHVLLRRQVAVKVLHAPAENSQAALQRFFVEMRALARLHATPNIVSALDAGIVGRDQLHTPGVHYLVMEHVEGKNLEQLVAQAPMTISQVCDVIYQVARALNETHKVHLIHRDIKPSNILLTPQGTAKLLDFGLALHFGGNRFTSPGTLLGTLNYMAPEQVFDAANVDIRADIFGLGSTLFYCLTGKAPFSSQGNVTHQVASRLTQRPPNLRSLRPDVSIELDAMIGRMMAHEREGRYPTPQSLLRALLPFVNEPSRPNSFPGSGRERGGRSDANIELSAQTDASMPTPLKMRVLIVDDDAEIRQLCCGLFATEGCQCHEASNGQDALGAWNEQNFDLVLLDHDMPHMSGRETLRRLREKFPGSNLKVVMMTGAISPTDMADLLALGADDYLTKPLRPQQLLARGKAALAHKAAQDRSEWLNRELVRINAELEERLTARDSALILVRKTLVLALAQCVESRALDGTIGHLTRVGKCATLLACQAAKTPRLSQVLDDAYIQMLESCAPLHDIGNIAMPDNIVHRTGPLEMEDRIILQAHTTIGAETLTSVAKRDRSATVFWQMAMDITRHHHERFDGAGYPDRLAGNDIPLAARLVAIADAYDMLRTPAELGFALSHNATVEMMVKGSRGRFDPLLLQAFQECEPSFEAVFRDSPQEINEHWQYTDSTA